MEVKKINEGITGQEASNLLYENDFGIQLRSDTLNAFKTYYGWELNGVSSYVSKDNVTFLNTTLGEYEVVFKVPTDTTPNQMLFHLGPFMVTLNSGGLWIYHTNGGDVTKQIPGFGVYAGTKIVLLLKIEEHYQIPGRYIMRVYVNGVLKDTVDPLDTFTTSSTQTVFIGAYQGYALFSALTLYSFTVRDANGVTLSAVNYDNVPTSTIDAKTTVYGMPVTQSSDSLLKNVPDSLYVTAGKEANIYWANIIEGYENNYIAELAISGSYIRNMVRGLRINYPTVGDFQGVLNLYDSSGVFLENKTITIKVKAATAGSNTLQFLFVGDSTIDDALMINGQPYYDHEGPQIVKMFYDLSNANKGYTPLMIGHKRDYPPYYHAGMSGWSSADFLNSNSPFWNNGKNDFKNYVQTQIATIPGAADRIDYLVYQIGINDLKNNSTAPETVIANIKTFIGQFLTDYTSAKVIIGFPASGNDTTGYSLHFYGVSSFTQFAVKMKDLQYLMLQAFDNGAYAGNVYVCNAGQWIDRIYGFPYNNVAVSARSAAEVMEHWDSVHPNEDGYNQMADAYFARVKNLV